LWSTTTPREGGRVAVGAEAWVDVRVGLGGSVDVLVGVAVAAVVAVRVAVALAGRVAVRVDVAGTVAVRVAVALAGRVAVGVRVEVAGIVAVRVLVALAATVAVRVRVAVGGTVAVRVRVGVAEGPEALVAVRVRVALEARVAVRVPVGGCVGDAGAVAPPAWVVVRVGGTPAEPVVAVGLPAPPRPAGIGTTSPGVEEPDVSATGAAGVPNTIPETRATSVCVAGRSDTPSKLGTVVPWAAAQAAMTTTRRMTMPAVVARKSPGLPRLIQYLPFTNPRALHLGALSSGPRARPTRLQERGGRPHSSRQPRKPRSTCRCGTRSRRSITQVARVRRTRMPGPRPG